MCVPIRDRDGKFPADHDRISAAEGLAVVETPPRTPNAEAIAGRVVRSLRAERLDRVPSVNQAHLRDIPAGDVGDDNHRRTHQGRDQRPPVPLAIARIRCRPLLGGLINDVVAA